MNLHEMLLKQLDLGLECWRQANQQAPRPQNGWIRTIRKALGMTIIQLANRLDLDPSRIVKIETAEPMDGVTFKTMREVAETLECEFVYALVPKKSLKFILLAKARNIVKKRMKRVSHSMALEDQSVSKEYQEEQMKDLIKMLLSKPRTLSSLWDESEAETLKQKKKIKIGRRKPKGTPKTSL